MILQQLSQLLYGGRLLHGDISSFLASIRMDEFDACMVSVYSTSL